MRADTLIVWTEPTTQLDIALSFQDAEGCEDIWQFICDVQRHLNNLPSESKWFLGRRWEVLMGQRRKRSTSNPLIFITPFWIPHARSRIHTNGAKIDLAGSITSQYQVSLSPLTVITQAGTS